MRRRKHIWKRRTVEEIAQEIRVELRGIVRKYKQLRRPLNQFTPVNSKPDDKPYYYVVFDNSEHRQITGLKIRTAKVHLPDENIVDSVVGFAASVWHLKDRLYQWAKATGQSVDIKALISKSKGLRVCADLTNKKKHARNENRSGLDPTLGLVEFDTSRSGPLEFFYNGATKDKELIVSNPVPIPYKVNIVADKGEPALGDAVLVIYEAFKDWLPIIKTMGALDSDDGESLALRKTLFPEQ